ncbi:MAG: cation-translocating P-type ATPase, partial [Allosphingosinicella sp.]
LADRPTMLHAGTLVAEGRGSGVAVATGAQTELGLIQASLGASLATPPPLVLRLQRLSRQVAAGAVMLILPLAAILGLQGEGLANILVLAVALAVSAIPEGLPIAVTVALAAATRRMAARNVIVRALPAVEGLGSCTLIASDKTGTLTLNRLSLERLLLPGGRVLARGDWEGSDDFDLQALALAAAICNEVAVGPSGMLVGDSVDVALAEFARDAGVDLHQARASPVVAELPYEPNNRFSAVAVRRDGAVTLYAKGAPEVVLGMCDDVPQPGAARAEALAGEGYRLLALASATGCDDALADCRAPRHLRLLGWVALMDPLRPEAAAAIARCAEAGISVRMITGDHPATARTIAGQLGLACASEDVVTGAEIAALAHDECRRAELIRAGRVFARIEPRQKLIIVEVLQAAGELVAVTGDGVNDAPALQAAHIGVAMGMGGTDVARGAADLVLTDDNFASIVAGVEEGRITYANIRKIVIFLLATGLAEITMFLGAIATGLPLPLTAVQLLWLNLVTNGVQDVMMGFGRGEGDELRRRPRRPGEPILDRRAIALVAPPALVMTVLALVMMDWSIRNGFTNEQMRNGVLLLVVLFQNVYVLCMRSERRPIWRESLTSNPWLLVGVAMATGLQVLAMHAPPLRAVLGTSPVQPDMLLFCLAGASLTVAVTEVSKWAVQRR